MKVSKYNFSLNMDTIDKVLMYNAFNNSLALTENDKFHQYRLFVEENKELQDEGFIRDLKMGGFLIEDDIDEEKELQIRLSSGRFYSSALGLTIAPTSNCNFRCVYCFEKGNIKNRTMTEETQEKLIEMVKSFAPKLREFRVTWYGGEPLLAFDIIVKLSREFMKICEENNINYSAGIITNGYMLTREKVILLNELKVDFYQVTIDGSKEHHNQSRPLANGGETYDRILSNIIDCYDVIPVVKLRVNVDKNNIQSGDEIIQLIKEKNLQDKVKPYLGKIMNDKNDISVCNECYSASEFGRVDLDYYKRNAEVVEWGFKYPDAKANFCGADSISSYVIDSDGLLYKCWCQIGEEDKAVGSLMNDNIFNRNIYYDFLLYNPLKDKCKDCSVLPICMGGCPNNRQLDNKEDRCSVYKDYLYEYLEFVAEQILKQREIEKENQSSECAVATDQKD